MRASGVQANAPQQIDVSKINHNIFEKLSGCSFDVSIIAAVYLIALVCGQSCSEGRKRNRYLRGSSSLRPSLSD